MLYLEKVGDLAGMCMCCFDDGKRECECMFVLCFGNRVCFRHAALATTGTVRSWKAADLHLCSPAAPSHRVTHSFFVVLHPSFYFFPFLVLSLTQSLSPLLCSSVPNPSALNSCFTLLLTLLALTGSFWTTLEKVELYQLIRFRYCFRCISGFGVRMGINGYLLMALLSKTVHCTCLIVSYTSPVV